MTARNVLDIDLSGPPLGRDRDRKDGMSTPRKSEIERALAAVRPSEFLDYRLFLQSLYEFLKRGIEGYSYKAFATDLGFNASTVAHQIVRGYRPLTVKAAGRVALALSLQGPERRYFLVLVSHQNAKTAVERERHFEVLLALKNETLPDEFDKDCLEFFSEWYHPVMRELVGTKNFVNDADWIVARIRPRLRKEQVEGSLALLERLDLIVRDEEKKTFVQTTRRISTGHRVKGIALVSYHQTMIDLAKEALAHVSSQRRDISALTLVVDEAGAQRLRSMIHVFQLQLLDEAEKPSKADQVFQVNIQLFPFTDEGT